MIRIASMNHIKLGLAIIAMEIIMKAKSLDCWNIFYYFIKLLMDFYFYSYHFSLCF